MITRTARGQRCPGHAKRRHQFYPEAWETKTSGRRARGRRRRRAKKNEQLKRAFKRATTLRHIVGKSEAMLGF